MGALSVGSRFQEVLETVEALPQEDQEILVEVIHQRLNRQGRDRIRAEVRESRAAYAEGDVRGGGPGDVLAELDA